MTTVPSGESKRLYEAIQCVIRETRGFNERKQEVWCKVCRYKGDDRLHDPECSIYELHGAFEEWAPLARGEAQPADAPQGPLERANRANPDPDLSSSSALLGPELRAVIEEMRYFKNTTSIQSWADRLEALLRQGGSPGPVEEQTEPKTDTRVDGDTPAVTDRIYRAQQNGDK